MTRQSTATHPVPSSENQPKSWLRAEYPVDVSIIIVNFNTCRILERALSSIQTSQHRCAIEVCVIDNHSRDGSAEMVRKKFPQIKCAVNKANLGHTGGCNQGIAMAEGRHIFLLNSDTVMLSGAVDCLANYLDEHPHVGAVGPKVLNVDGTIQGTVKKFPTPWAALFGRFSWLTRWLPNNRFSRNYLIYLDQDFSRPFAVDSASAAALMVRREALDAAGLLDKRFFLYWNDVDWCRSIWESGFEIHCVPEAVLKHEEHHGGSRSGAWRRLRSVANFHLGAYHYYRKWHVKRVWHLNHFLAIAGLSVRAVMVIVVNQIGSLFRREPSEHR